MPVSIDEATLLAFLNAFDAVESGSVPKLQSARNLLEPLTLLALLNDISPSAASSVVSSDPGIKDVMGAFHRYTDRVFRKELSPFLMESPSPDDEEPDKAVLTLGELLCVAAVDWHATDGETSQKFIDKIMLLSETEQKGIRDVLYNRATPATMGVDQDDDEGDEDAAAHRRVSSSSMGRRSSLASQRYSRRWNDDDASSGLDSHRLKEDVTTLQCEIDSLKEKNKQLEKANREHETSSQRLLNDTKARDESGRRDQDEIIAKLEQDLAAVKNETKELRQEFDRYKKDKQKEMTEMEDQLDLAQSERQNMKHMKSQLDEAKKKLQEIVALKGHIRALEDEQKESITTVLKMKQDMGAIETTKNQLEHYKQKVSELESEKGVNGRLIEQLEQAVEGYKTRLSELQRQCEILDHNLKAAQAEHEATILELQQPVSDVTARERDEELTLLRRENELLKNHGVGSSSRDATDIKRITELEHELDVVKKTKEFLDKKLLAAANEKASLKRQLEGATGGENVGQLLSKIADLENETQSTKTALEVSQMEKKKDAELTNQKISQLEEAAKAAQTHLTMVEDATESKVQKKCDEAMSVLKSQLTIRDREVVAYKSALIEHIALHKNELNLTSSALHTLAYRYWVQKTRATRAETEMEAFKAKLVQKRQQKLLGAATRGQGGMTSSGMQSSDIHSPRGLGSLYKDDTTVYKEET